MKPDFIQTEHSDVYLGCSQRTLEMELTGIRTRTIEIEVSVKEGIALARWSPWTEVQLPMLATEVSTLTP